MLMRMSKWEVRRRVNKLLDKEYYNPLKRSAKIIFLPGGSNREFFRILDKVEEIVFIIMFSDTKKAAREYLQMQKYLAKKRVGVPEIFFKDIDDYIIIMEDVGTKSLYNLVRKSDNMDFIEHLYKKVIKNLIHLQLEGNKGIEKCKPVYTRIFNYDVLRWESHYFTWAFLERFCGLPEEDINSFEDDFHNLAHSLINEPLFFMHRDFQSQNIFLKDGFVRIVDFQSAHRGMLTYDLASLLRDSYVSLPKEMRDDLISFYYSSLREKVDVYKDFKVFRKVYVLSSIQRNMQALGAFAFLSEERGKNWFLKAIPQGLKYLREGLNEIDEFTNLKKIVNSSRVTKCVKSIVL